MTTFIYSATASADGYIAGPDGDMSWLSPFLGAEPDPIFERLTPRITALLQGRITYDGDDPRTLETPIRKERSRASGTARRSC